MASCAACARSCAENGRMVANGARRTDGHVTELSRPVYSTCNLCAEDPSHAPLWQLRARSATQDTENKQIEYRDAVLDIYGIPVFYFPYFSHASPDQKRASGFLVPGFGQQTRLGTFLTVPYYAVLDDQSDATFSPTIGSNGYGNLNTEYRRRFNNGTVNVESGAWVRQQEHPGRYLRQRAVRLQRPVSLWLRHPARQLVAIPARLPRAEPG